MDTEEEAGRPTRDHCTNPVGYDDGSGHDGSSGNDEPWLNSGYILKLNGTEFANGLDVPYKRKRGCEYGGYMGLYLRDQKDVIAVG